MSSRGTKTSTIPSKIRATGAIPKQPVPRAAALKPIQEKTGTVDGPHKINSQTSSCASSSLKYLTPTQKQQRVQAYIKSISSYKKSPTASIATNVPRNNTLGPKEDTKCKMLVEKFKEPIAKAVERAAKEMPTRSITTNNQNSNIKPAMSLQKCLSEQDKPKNSKSNIDYNNPKPGTSKPIHGDLKKESKQVNFIVNQRKLVKEQPKDVVTVIEENSADSVDIVILTRNCMKIPVKKNDPKLIIQVSDTAGEMKNNGVIKELGECPICFERLGPTSDISATQCGHVYCTACICATLKERKLCPKCRKPLELNQIHKLYL